MKPKPVWKEKSPPYELGKDGFGFRDMKKNYYEWIDPKIFLPYAYDLVYMKMERKTIPGWWTGNEWEGYRMLPGDKVNYWKFKEEKEYGYKKEQSQKES